MNSQVFADTQSQRNADQFANLAGGFITDFIDAGANLTPVGQVSNWQLCHTPGSKTSFSRGNGFVPVNLLNAVIGQLAFGNGQLYKNFMGFSGQHNAGRPASRFELSLGNAPLSLRKDVCKTDRSFSQRLYPIPPKANLSLHTFIPSTADRRDPKWRKKRRPNL